jgi:hypothetical protein
MDMRHGATQVEVVTGSRPVIRGGGSSEMSDQSCPSTRFEGELEAAIRIVEVTGEGLWRVRSPGSQRASAVVDTRGEAEARAREILRRCGGGEIRIHDIAGDPLIYTVPPRVAMPGRLQIIRQPRG